MLEQPLADSLSFSWLTSAKSSLCVGRGVVSIQYRYIAGDGRRTNPAVSGVLLNIYQTPDNASADWVFVFVFAYNGINKENSLGVR